MNYKTVLDEMTWSFSRIHLWEQCRYAFYKKYIEGNEGDSNYFAENGKAMHKTFEKLFKNEITLEDAPAFYIDEYENIYYKTKQSTMDSTFEKCLDYLCSLDIDIKDYDVIAVEEKLVFTIGKYKFVGYADLILRHKVTKEIILIDHKSLDHFYKKDGTVLKNQLENFKAYKHQMYLYCKGIFDKLGNYPLKIIWHHFKDEGQLTKLSFSEEDYLETLEWAKQTIKQIYKDKTFNETRSYMNCNVLCNFRNECEYKTE